MQVDYIIVQAGGKGTRMEELTKNKPKALVPVDNAPIIFHLFNKYPNKKFIIIGDYKYECLNNYLNTFAKNIDYILIKSKETGNIGGINTAITYIPDNRSFMIIWCDLILNKNVPNLDELESGNYIMTMDSSCSWSFNNNVLEKKQTNVNGVAGGFIFKNKNKFDDINSTGSLTEWIKTKNIKMTPLKIDGSSDVGSFHLYKNKQDTEHRCRPYNKMYFNENEVTKMGITEEGKKLIDREILWYNKMIEYGFTNIPEIISTDPLTMKRINGTNIFQHKTENVEEKKKILDKLVSAINIMHNYKKDKYFLYEDFIADLKKEYFGKTIDRLMTIKNVIPFANDKYITINNMICKNIITNHELLYNVVEQKLLQTAFCPIHGDCTLTNTMIDDKGEIFFIDARGYFGDHQIIGDIRYDVAKLYYSINTNFDQFNIKNSNLSIYDNKVKYSIGSSGWEELSDYLVKQCDSNIDEIRIINSIIWMSLASHVWEDFDSMCIAFYNGLYLFNKYGGI